MSQKFHGDRSNDSEPVEHAISYCTVWDTNLPFANLASCISTDFENVIFIVVLSEMWSNYEYLWKRSSESVEIWPCVEFWKKISKFLTVLRGQSRAVSSGRVWGVRTSFPEITGLYHFLYFTYFSIEEFVPSKNKVPSRNLSLNLRGVLRLHLHH